MFTKIVALSVALAASVTAVSIDASSLVQCASQILTVSGGSVPYYVAVLPAVNPCESDSIAEFHDVYGNTVDYIANLPQGTQVQLYVVDNDDQESWSRIITVGGSGDSSCVGGTAPEQSPPAANPPAANPPAANPPAANPPAANPPASNPPPANQPTYEDAPSGVDHVEEDDVNTDDLPLDDTEDVGTDVTPETEAEGEDLVDETDVDVEDVADGAEEEGTTYTAPAFQPNSVSNTGTGSTNNGGADEEEQGGASPPPANAVTGLNAGSSIFVSSGSLVVSLVAVVFALQA